MSKISTLLEAIETELKGAQSLSGVRDVAVSPGRFNAAEIGRHSFKTPALRIAFLGAAKSKARADKTRRFEGAFGIFVMTDGHRRDVEGVVLTEAVAEVVEANRFSTGAGYGLPDSVRIDALYTGEIDERGISLHAVTWTQAVHLGTSAALAVAPDPNAVIDPDIVLNRPTEVPRGDGS